MQTTPLTHTASSPHTDGLRVTERSRGTAHPQTRTTRDLVARSLLLRPDAATASYVRR